MVKMILSGCNGYMGRVITTLVANDATVCIIAGIDIVSEKHADYPVFASPDELIDNADTTTIIKDADCIVDFSSPSALSGLLKLSESKKLPLILCATGYTPAQLTDIEDASEHIPIFRSDNMSLGINLLVDLIKRACLVLGEDFDVEIVERHHSRKVDAPSGTALMLADAATSALPYDPEYIYERKSRREPRSKKEIGISAVRGGTIVGVHDVIFAGKDEVIELRHSAASRDVFASGAIKAAKFMVNKPVGKYSMKDVLAIY